MKIYWGLNNKVSGEYSVAIGVFDGIHLGHQKIIKKAIQKAGKLKIKSGIVTFNPHPQKVISGRNESLILLPLEDKIRYFHNLGIDSLFFIDFNEPFSNLTPEQFIQHLFEFIDLKSISVGFNFHFGYKGEGNVKDLAKFGEEFQFEVNILPPVKYEEQIISSTLIRDLVRKGEVSFASEMLGHLYFISGDVVKGHGRGSKLGFSTANISPDNEVIPKDGVYATLIEIDKSVYPSITNIGICPTFKNEGHSIEVNILDYKKNIYDKWVKIFFIKRLRAEKKFESPEALTAQIKADTKESGEIFKKKHKPLELR